LEAWGNLHIENGIYSVEIPQDFLDKAVYPIKSNDTFGYTSIGSYATGNAGYARGQYAIPSEGTLVSVSAYVDTNNYLESEAKYAIYKTSDTSRVDYTNEFTLINGFKNWKTVNLVIGASITTTEYSVVHTNRVTGNNRIYTDYIGSGQTACLAGVTYATFPPTTLSLPHYTLERFSIYATYESSTPPAEEERRILSPIIFD
jgi:hypothetical protein